MLTIFLKWLDFNVLYFLSTFFPALKLSPAGHCNQHTPENIPWCQIQTNRKTEHKANQFIQFPLKLFLSYGRICRWEFETEDNLGKTVFSGCHQCHLATEWERGWKVDCFCLRVRVGISQNEAGSQLCAIPMKSSEQSCDVGLWVCMWEKRERKKREKDIWMESAAATC